MPPALCDLETREEKTGAIRTSMARIVMAMLNTRDQEALSGELFNTCPTFRLLDSTIADRLASGIRMVLLILCRST